MKFIRYKNILNEEVYYSLPQPIEKNIDGEIFIEVTQDFQHTNFIKYSSLKRDGTEMRVI